jgi:hypothetical protein
MFRSLLVLLLVFASSRLLAAQAAPAAAWPAYTQASILENAYGKANESLYERSVSTADLAAINEAIRSMPRFADYLYSGCHDRAHAGYLLLPPALAINSMKIWVFAPQRFAPGISGMITLRENPSRTTEAGVRWGYHVAVAFKDSLGGHHIYDPALAPDGLITREQWFALMEVPQLSFWTLMPGWVYSFASIPVAHETIVARPEGVMNGGFFQYNQTALREHWIPQALARDAVGQAVATGETCRALESLLMNPGEMQTRLRAHNLPADCSPQVELFDREMQKWIGLLERR